MALEKPGNYTLGRGQIFLARNEEGGPANGFLYVGNTPALDLTVESETLDHFSSDAGINELDARVILSVTRNGTFSMDDIQPENLAIFVRGSAVVMNVDAAAGQTYDIESPVQDMYYQIGQSTGNPTGDLLVSGVTVNEKGSATLVAAATYDVNPKLGLIKFTTAPGKDVTVNYTRDAMTHTDADPHVRVTSGFDPVRGSMMFLENNPRGRSRRYLFTNVEITANGAASLKGDEWRQMPMSYSVLKPEAEDVQAVYIDNIPTGIKLT